MRGDCVLPYHSKQPTMNSEIAFISDIHANLQALEAVLADIKNQEITEIYCLGDVVGYGGNPGECIDLIRACGIPCIQGNHDAMATGDFGTREKDINPKARLVIEWTYKALSFDQRSWLAELPMTFERPEFQAVHAMLYEPTEWRYVLNQELAELHFPRQTHPLCLIGHTHQPAYWVDGEFESRAITGRASIDLQRKQVVNVGSVGQPRDRDPRACYTILRPDLNEVQWQRVNYNITGAQYAIEDAGLPFSLAERLQQGR